jgi:prepilin-type N-terminal cleavage/methylation domain-containing protein
MKNIKQFIREGEQGLSLIEILVAIVLLGILSVAILQAGQVTYRVSTGVDNKRNAQNLAELQMEYVKGLGYAAEYPGVTPEANNFSGYSVTTEVRRVGLDTDGDGITESPARDNNIQLITVRVRYNSAITGINITAGGSGYTSAPVVDFSGGGGTGATAIATISGGVVTGITLTGKGTGYTSAPDITFSGGGGMGAAASVTFTDSLVILEDYKTQ